MKIMIVRDSREIMIVGANWEKEREADLPDEHLANWASLLSGKNELVLIWNVFYPGRPKIYYGENILVLISF